MVDYNKLKLGIGGAALLAIGAVGGAGAVSATRPSVEMAPVSPIAISALATKTGVVTIKGQVAGVYGDKFLLKDASGQAMVDAGRDAPALTNGQALTVQGRYDDGQLRASFLVDAAGTATAVGHGKHHKGHEGREGREGPDGPGMRHGGRDGGPNPCEVVPVGPGAAAPVPARAAK